MENDKMMMYLDPPRWLSAQRIDVTMAFNLGLAVAQQDYEKVSCIEY